MRTRPLLFSTFSLWTVARAALWRPGWMSAIRKLSNVDLGFCVWIVCQFRRIQRFGKLPICRAAIIHSLSINLNIRALMPKECASCVPLLRAKEETSVARKLGQLIARGDRRWLIRVYLGRDHETKQCNYHTERSVVHARSPGVLTIKLRERDLGAIWNGPR